MEEQFGPEMSTGQSTKLCILQGQSTDRKTRVNVRPWDYELD